MIMLPSGGKPGHISKQAIAVLALMEGGIDDETVIAQAVGIDVDEVRRIESANDLEVRRVAVDGIPADFLFRLRRAVVCPRCGSRIFLVPCIFCQMDRSHRETRRVAKSRRKRTGA